MSNEITEKDREHLERINQLGYIINRVSVSLKAIDNSMTAIIHRQDYDKPIEKNDLDALFGISYSIQDQIESLEKYWEEYA